jgi:hypothetical protein
MQQQLRGFYNSLLLTSSSDMVRIRAVPPSQLKGHWTAVLDKSSSSKPMKAEMNLSFL